ncbi:hypothetical protein HYV70_00500 [Candidatus Uhrbacteria bacterium]|nr:hypothetical protein [Candidatus Uhrbacteria bacterium]
MGQPNSAMKKLILTLVAFVVWSALIGWKVTLIAMSGLWIHGMGHILVARHYGMKTSGIYFIPLLGAVEPIGIEQDNLWQMAMVSLAGPFAGVINTALLYGIGYVINSEVAIAAAGVVAVINLFNLIPLSPLDGGRAMQALMVSAFQKAWVGMIPLAIICFAFLRIIGVSPIMFIFLSVIAVVQIKKEMDTQQAEEEGKLQTPRIRLNLREFLYVMGIYTTLTIVLLEFIILSS